MGRATLLGFPSPRIRNPRHSGSVPIVVILQELLRISVRNAGSSITFALRENMGTDRAHARLCKPPSTAMEDRIRTLVVSLLGVAAVAAGLVLIRQKGPEPQVRIRDMHAGESLPGTISLEKLRELGY